MNVVLLGKGDLSIKVAEYCKKNFNLSLVIPDKPEPTWTGSLQNWCIENQVPYIESGDFKDIYKNQRFDLAISIFYGKIIKKEFIDSCEKIINLHNAPLPKYRGVRPINWALKNNEKYHGVTIHEITEGIDDGPILGKITYPIYPEIEEVEDVYRKSLDYGWLLFKDVISKLDYVYKNSIIQEESESSYFSNNEIKDLGDRSDFKIIKRKKLTVDVICYDSNYQKMPIFNDLQALTLNDSDYFEINKIVKLKGVQHKSASALDELKSSKADILISICPDQHHLYYLDSIKNFDIYKKVVYINDEPIYIPKSFKTASQTHNNFLPQSNADVILYTSPIDKKLSPIDCIKLDWYCPVITSEETENYEKEFRAVASSNLIPEVVKYSKDRWDFLTFLKENKEKYDFDITTHISKSWDETYNLINRSKITLIGPHAYHIHWLRFNRALKLNTLPVIVNYDGWMDQPGVREAYQKEFEENGKTCLLTEMKDLDKTLSSLQDEEWVDSLLENVKKISTSCYSIQDTWNELYKNLNL